MSITLLTLLLSAALSLAALPPDFRLDEHPVYGPAQQPSLGLTLLGYSLSVDPVDGLHYITGGVPAGVPQIAVSAAIYGAKASDKTAFSQEATFVPPPGYTGTLDFGTAVDIFGDYAVVSSPSSLFSDATLGHVFVYRRQGATWTQQSPSVIGNPLIDQCKFGTSLALFGTQLIVGCTGLAGVYNDTVSAAFLFNVTDGTLLNTFTPTQAPLLRFAQAVEITATHAFVSQPLANNTGAVHIFDLANGLNYTVIDGSNFGRSLAAENGSVLAGGYGYAHLLAFNSTTNDFEIEATFLPVATSRGDFGRDVAFSGRRVLIGNPYSTGKVQASGSVQVHFKDPDTESWGPGILVGASDGLPAAQYGLSVALSADQIFVGAIGGYCQTCIAYTPGVVYVYNQANSCGTPPIEDSPTVCSTLGQLLYFNPDLKVTKPVILTNPIVFIGNVSIGANVTVFISNNDTTSPITGLSCVGVTDGSLNVELTSPVDGNVVVINSRCVSGQFNGVVLKPRADDCRAYTVTGQTRDPATGSLTLLLKVDKSGCGSNLARKRGIIAGAVVGGVLLIAGLVLLFFFIGYKLHWSFLDSVFNKREDPTIVHI